MNKEKRPCKIIALMLCIAVTLSTLISPPEKVRGAEILIQVYNSQSAGLPVGVTTPWTVPKTGWYRLQVWGAGTKSKYNETIGYGGLTEVDAYLEKGTVLYLTTGGMGVHPSALGLNSETWGGGGANGGGNTVDKDNGVYHQSGGGGATDIRIGGTGEANRLLVGAGAGGMKWGSQGSNSPVHGGLPSHYGNYRYYAFVRGGVYSDGLDAYLSDDNLKAVVRTLNSGIDTNIDKLRKAINDAASVYGDINVANAFELDAADSRNSHVLWTISPDANNYSNGGWNHNWSSHDMLIGQPYRKSTYMWIKEGHTKGQGMDAYGHMEYWKTYYNDSAWNKVGLQFRGSAFSGSMGCEHTKDRTVVYAIDANMSESDTYNGNVGNGAGGGGYIGGISGADIGCYHCGRGHSSWDTPEMGGWNAEAGSSYGGTLDYSQFIGSTPFYAYTDASSNTGVIFKNGALGYAQNSGNGLIAISLYSNTTTITFDANGGTLPTPGTNLNNPNPVVAEYAVGGTGNTLTVQYDRGYFNSMGSDLPTRAEYNFMGWYDINGIQVYDKNGTFTPNTGYWDGSGNWISTVDELTLYAHWKINSVAYKVSHYKQNVNDDGYTLAETEDLTGPPGTVVTPAVRSYEGFVSPPAQTVTINENGSTEVKYYYNRVTPAVILNGGRGISKLYVNNEEVAGGTARSFRYQKRVTVNAALLAGYQWGASSGWTGTYENANQSFSFTMPLTDVNLTANAEAVVYTISYELNGGSVTGNPVTYTVESPSFALYNPSRTGYSFAGWTGTGLAQPSTSVMILRGSTGNRHYVANWVDDIAPVISVSPEGSGGAYRQNMDIVISVSEKGTGLAADNSYEFFVSSVANPTSSVGLRTYTSGATVNIGDSLNGKYYVFVKAVKDNAGNVSSRDGIMVDIDGVMYHRFGLYLFDNIKPMVMLEQEHSRVSANVVLTIELLDPGTEASGISSSSNLVYYVSDSSTMLRNGSFKNYVSGVPFEVGEGLDLTKKWYIFIECVEDNAGNISVNEGTIVSYGGKDYHCFGPLSLDSEPPVVEVSPESAFNVQSVEVVIEWTETGSGLASDNVYEYYLSDNPDVLTGGVWTPYISGVGFSIGHGLDGNKYLFIKRVSDIAGNISEEKGDLKTIGGDTYHRNNVNIRQTWELLPGKADYAGEKKGGRGGIPPSSLSCRAQARAGKKLKLNFFPATRIFQN